MHTEAINHDPAITFLQTGAEQAGRPSFGSWISYGLGTENHNLPGFISLNTSRPSAYSSAFLPSIHNGTPIGVNGQEMAKATIDNVTGAHLPAASKRHQLDFVQVMNHQHL